MREVVWVGTDDGLVLYEGRGDGAWRRVRRALAGVPVTAIVATDAEVLLVRAADTGHETFDGGETWYPASSTPDLVGKQVVTVRGLVAPAFDRLAGALAYARLPGKPAQLVGAGADGSMLFRSYDDGIHWEPVQIVGGGAGIVTSIVPVVGLPGRGWAGTRRGTLLRTADQGATWHPVLDAGAPIWCLAALLLE